MRNKFALLCEQIQQNVDMLMICETKIDYSFANVQFQILLFWLNRHKNGGRIMIFIRGVIPAKLLLMKSRTRTKLLISYCFNPHRIRITSHLQSLSKSSSKFENMIVLEGYSATLEELTLKTFCDSFILKNIVKEPTCLKNPNKSSCIDLILTKKIKCFQNSLH